MSLQERRTLKEICLLVDRSSINVLWADEILKDGIVLHSTDHRGAYPLDESGHVDPSVASLLGGTLTQIIGSMADGLQQNLTVAQQQIVALENGISIAVQERDDIASQLNQANYTITQLNAQLQALYDSQASELPAQNVLNEQVAPDNE